MRETPAVVESGIRNRFLRKQGSIGSCNCLSSLGMEAIEYYFSGLVRLGSSNSLGQSLCVLAQKKNRQGATGSRQGGVPKKSRIKIIRFYAV